MTVAKRWAVELDGRVEFTGPECAARSIAREWLKKYPGRVQVVPAAATSTGFPSSAPNARVSATRSPSVTVESGRRRDVRRTLHRHRAIRGGEATAGTDNRTVAERCPGAPPGVP